MTWRMASGQATTTHRGFWTACERCAPQEARGELDRMSEQGQGRCPQLGGGQTQDSTDVRLSEYPPIRNNGSSSCDKCSKSFSILIL